MGVPAWLSQPIALLQATSPRICSVTHVDRGLFRTPEVPGYREAICGCIEDVGALPTSSMPGPSQTPRVTIACVNVCGVLLRERRRFRENHNLETRSSRAITPGDGFDCQMQQVELCLTHFERPLCGVQLRWMTGTPWPIRDLWLEGHDQCSELKPPDQQHSL